MRKSFEKNITGPHHTNANQTLRNFFFPAHPVDLYFSITAPPSAPSKITMTSSYSVQNFSRRVSFVEENFGEFKKPKSFLEVVGGLDALFSSDDVNISLVKAYLSSYDVRKEDLQDFVSFDDKKYTRNLIWEGNGKYNIMLACWDKKQSRYVLFTWVVDGLGCKILNN